MELINSIILRVIKVIQVSLNRQTALLVNLKVGFVGHGRGHLRNYRVVLDGLGSHRVVGDYGCDIRAGVNEIRTKMNGRLCGRSAVESWILLIIASRDYQFEWDWNDEI